MLDYAQFLNEEQISAVKTGCGPILVSAGAGSGKTRLLTYRIHYLVNELNVNPLNILAITFTNKASNEMKLRIQKIVPNGELVTVCTIHSLCVKILRQYASFLEGYTSNFSIYSENDSNKLFKKIFDGMSIENDLREKIKKHISIIKNNNMSLNEYLDIIDYLNFKTEIEEVYTKYQNELKSNNAMDFDDLLLKTFFLLKNNAEVLASIQNKYKYIHVDEFQDTNIVQYEIIKLIAQKHQNLFVVGDENQSIYGWRGANIGNMSDFLTDFENVQIKKLERNYRSTQNILNRANELIKYNDNLIEKTLYTTNDMGEEVKYYNAYDEKEEAEYVVRNISRLIKNGTNPNEIAILMRVNALSRPFEERLLSYNIPHKIYNGFKFYERVEIKNTLAYVIAILNSNDNENFLRIINYPKRKIGDASIKKLEDIANSSDKSLFDTVMDCENIDIPNALKLKLEPLKTLFDEIQKRADNNIFELVQYIVNFSGIKASFDLQDENDMERFYNVNSLLQSMEEFVKANPSANIKDYIDSVSLISNIDELEEDASTVSIASVHGAKGLEFDVVFIVGAEEGIFPVSRKDESDMQEERRLMYVAITRAKKLLFVTSCKTRFLYGSRNYCLRSRFIDEAGLYQKPTTFNPATSKGWANNVSSKYNSQATDIDEPKVDKLDKSNAIIGAKVRHIRFGEGVIVNNDELLSTACVNIDFDGFGVKTLCLDYAPLTLVTGENDE